MKPTYYDRLTGPDTRTVEELCRPLSAKVLPRIAMLGVNGEITEGQAIGNQRNSRRSTNNGRAQKGKP